MTNSAHPCVQLDRTIEGRLTVWLDSPERSVNLIDADMLAGLEAAAAHVAEAGHYKVVLFRSRKRDCFFAGADVRAIASLKDPEEIREIVARGQRLMQSIAGLHATTVAVIDGSCMGGGLEFAMACDYRLATDSTKTRLALPEIRLGLIPGWGGTQRLPRLVGLRQALKMILKGSQIDARNALRMGLVDTVVDKDSVDLEIDRFIERLANSSANRTLRHEKLFARFLDRTRLGHLLVLHATHKKIAAETMHYPALQKAVEAVRRGAAGQANGYAYEQTAFSELVGTPTAQSLLGLFLQRDRAKKSSTWTSPNLPIQPEAIRQLAVIGAGAMGAGIGTLAAQSGMHVVFKEISDLAARAGAERVDQLLNDQVAAKRLKAEDVHAIRERIVFTTNWQELSNCDLAIEAVLEIEAVKSEVFQNLDRVLAADAILVSNTSSLNVTRLAAATDRKSKVAGLHFFNPVHRMELVEVVRTEMTDEATLAKLLMFVRQLSKTPLVTSDKPGFLVNRVLFPYLGEAIRMVSEGHPVLGIDSQLRRFGMPVGPLELIDQVGVDIAMHVAHSLSKLQSDSAAPADFLADMVERGWLGKKSGKGFYEWQNSRKPNANLTAPATRVEEPQVVQNDGLTAIQRRLVYPMLNEAVHCLDELVVAEAWMVDLGMVLGTGFAPMRGGPLRMVDALGIQTVVLNLHAMHRTHGPRFAPADGLLSRSRRAENFFAGGFFSDTQAWESSHESRCTTES